MTSKKPIIVVHDLFGTAPTAALRRSYPSLTPLRAHSIILDWYQCFQRDLTALSINDSYQSASLVFKETLPRALKQAGLSTNPENGSTFDPADEGVTGPQQALGAERVNPYPTSITQPILDSLQQLTPRPGFHEAFTKILRPAHGPDSPRRIQVWAATNGGAELARKLLLAGVDGQEEYGGELTEDNRGVGIFSCDEVKVSKPDPRVYAYLRRKLGITPAETPSPSSWFVASHQ
ncbi:hypothetical protein V8E36_008704 [Tilletia maclaganii]